ncbi:MAG: NeuD/PglB/VioB family sugar acetyltransferase [Vicinamibacteria bacterium]
MSESVRRLVVIGGGEHARVLMEAARSCPQRWQLLGFVDPEPCAETARRLGLARLGGDDEGLRLAREVVSLAIGVGSVGVGTVRRQVAARYDEAGAAWATIVHAAAWVSPSAMLSDGVFVSAGACVNGGATIGRHCVVNTGAVVEHDASLGDFSQLGPAVVIGGGARIGAGAYVGLGACVRDHVTIGCNATIGMGAVVVSHVADEAVVAGVPAAPFVAKVRR